MQVSNCRKHRRFNILKLLYYNDRGKNSNNWAINLYCTFFSPPGSLSRIIGLAYFDALCLTSARASYAVQWNNICMCHWFIYNTLVHIWCILMIIQAAFTWDDNKGNLLHKNNTYPWMFANAIMIIKNIVE